MPDHYWRCFGCGITMSKDAKKGTFEYGDCDIITIADGFYHEGPDGKLCGPMRFCSPGRDNWEKCSTEELEGYQNHIPQEVREINQTVDKIREYMKGNEE